MSAHEIIAAAAISVFVCPNCGDTHIVLFDESDNPVAEIVLGDSEMISLTEDMMDISEDIAGDGVPDTIGPVEGTA